VVIDDDHVGLRRFAPRGKDETLLEEPALEARAQVRLGGDLVPHILGRLDRQVAEGAIFRLARPLDQVDQWLLAVAREQRGMRSRRLLEPLQAEVVPPPLQQGEPDRLVVERSREERQVLLDQLFLEVDRVRRDDRPFLVGR
jgi:hypothetical protein